MTELFRETKPIKKLNCTEIQELIQTEDWQNSDSSETIQQHLGDCAQCYSVWEFEKTLQEIIIPEILPQPSANFESNLMAVLGIKPQPIFLPAAPANPITNWSWISGLVVLAGLIITNWQISKQLITNLAALGYAKFAELFAGKIIIAGDAVVGTLPGVPGFNAALSMNIILGLIVAVGGVYAVSRVMK